MPATSEGLGALARARGIGFGTAVQGELLAQDPVYAAAVAAEAQLLVPEWEAKWDALQPREGEFDFGPLAVVAGFAQAQRKQLRGHALVWHNAMPDWLGPALAEGPARARGVLAAHLEAVLGATQPLIRDWDVVNEALANPPGSRFTDQTPARGVFRDTPWLRALGPGYIELALRLARERDRTLRLTINDYGLEGDTPWAEQKRQAMLALVRALLEARCPLDAVGLQAHLQVDEPFRPEPLAGFIQALRGMGLSVLITELDCREGARLPSGLEARDDVVAGYVQQVVGTALAAGCRTVLAWGLSDRDSWLVRDADVARRDGQQHRGHPLDAAFRRKAMWQALARTFADA
jgi:endo-1,4-beta-xylanase